MLSHEIYLQDCNCGDPTAFEMTRTQFFLFKGFVPEEIEVIRFGPDTSFLIENTDIIVEAKILKHGKYSWISY